MDMQGNMLNPCSRNSRQFSTIEYDNIQGDSAFSKE